MGFFSRAFLVFLMKESKTRRRKQPGKLMAKSHLQPVNLAGARPLMSPLQLPLALALKFKPVLWVVSHVTKPSRVVKETRAYA